MRSTMSSAGSASPLATDDRPDALSERLGHRFADPALLRQALSHGSWCAEHDEPESYERLEFLGDAVVELVVREELYRTLPDRDEGELSKLRRSVVNTYALADVAAAIGLGDALLLGRGEELSGGRRKPSLLCNVFEAVVGAAFLDGGFDVARAVVLRQLGDRIASAVVAGPDSDDHKTRLQELAVRLHADAPRYDVTDEGPEHEKWFHATVEVAGELVGRGEGQSKKLAEQQAARDALAQLAEHAVLTRTAPEMNGAGDA